MALSKLAANSFDLTDDYALTGTETGVVSTQKLFLIKNLDASSSSTLSFVDGSNSVDLDNTYKTYYFKFVNIHASGSSGDLVFQGNAAGGSGFNETITSTVFQSAHSEDNTTNAEIGYTGSADQANGTGFQIISATVGNGNDECVSGVLILYDPSNTTFVKHFMIKTNDIEATNYLENRLQGGYFNTTSAINNIIFRFYTDTGLGTSVQIQGGTIDLFGVV